MLPILRKQFQSIILTHHANNRIGIIALNRPECHNALNPTMCSELADALEGFDSSPDIGAVVLTGSRRVFCSGADIKEFVKSDFVQNHMKNVLENLHMMDKIKTPIVAAVNGFALGGGFELALASDIVIASENAIFGLPEVTLGTIPGNGGTQRLIRAIGKSRAMEYILTGKPIDAHTAHTYGLVSKVCPKELTLSEAINVASKIASFPKSVTTRAKEAILMAEETGLTSGLQYEQHLFESTFQTTNQLEGMAAFLEGREPRWV
jgi:enoyl-CoA hydratase/carnithine racemase